jgi:hypothetical protein
MKGRADDQVIGRSKTLQAGCQIRRLANGGLLPCVALADGRADHHEPRGDTDAYAQLLAVHRLIAAITASAARTALSASVSCASHGA